MSLGFRVSLGLKVLGLFSDDVLAFGMFVVCSWAPLLTIGGGGGGSFGEMQVDLPQSQGSRLMLRVRISSQLTPKP